MPGGDLRSLIISRRREAEENARLDQPAERFTTRGAFYRGNTFHAATQQSTSAAETDDVTTGEPTTASAWRGVPGFPGIARGRARRVNDARGATLLQGEILGAERAEPGWAPLLTAAGGMVLAHGSTFSRVAVIARELGIPAVFCAVDIFDGVRDGEILEINGSAGTVTRVRDA